MNTASPRRLRPRLAHSAALAALLTLALPGCAVVSVAGTVASTAVSVAGTVVGTTVAVTGKVIEKAVDVAVADPRP